MKNSTFLGCMQLGFARICQCFIIHSNTKFPFYSKVWKNTNQSSQSSMLSVTSLFKLMLHAKTYLEPGRTFTMELLYE